MRPTRFAILALAAGVLLAAAPARAGDDIRNESTPAFETPGAQPTPAAPDIPHTPKMDDPAMHPDPVRVPGSSTAGDEYVVKQGDTLAEIAAKELGSPDKWRVIARANGIEDPDTVYVGQKLRIPHDEPSQL